MANSVNKGNQKLRIQYGQRITSRAENQSMYKLMPTGIYQGMVLSAVDEAIEVSPGVVFIEDTAESGEIALRVETLSTYQITTHTEIRPFIVVTFDWVEDANNYMDFIAKSAGEITSKDIILGKANYSGSTFLGTFDLTLRRISPLTMLSALKDILTVTGNVSITGNLEVLGETVVINTTELEIEDNLMLLNKGQTGIPPTSLVSGFEVDRGDLVNTRFIFDELDDEWKAGELGAEKTLVREGKTISLSGLITGTGTVGANGSTTVSVGSTGISLMTFTTTPGLEKIVVAGEVHATEFIEV